MEDFGDEGEGPFSARKMRSLSLILPQLLGDSTDGVAGLAQEAEHAIVSWDAKSNTMHFIPGQYQLMIGSSSADANLLKINTKL